MTEVPDLCALFNSLLTGYITETLVTIDGSISALAFVIKLITQITKFIHALKQMAFGSVKNKLSKFTDPDC